MKKINLLLILSLLLMLTLNPTFVGGQTLSDCQTILYNGTDGNITWELCDDGTLTIGGSGDMYDYVIDYDYGSTAPWAVHRDSFTALVIEEGVTRIGNYAFPHCINFTGSLTLPEGLISIGNSAFIGCSSFNGNLTFPESLESISDHAFYWCNYFTGSLILPEKLTKIGDATFRFCSGFTGNLTLPKGIKSIGNLAFSGCRGLSGSLILPEGLISIGGMAFRSCTGFIGNLIFPGSLESIGDGAFSWCEGFTDVINHSIEPQTIELSVFDYVSINNITLHVPNNSVEKYSEFPVWKLFGRIDAIVTSIKENEIPSFSIYPNPAYNILNLLREKTGKARIEIYKINGSLIKEIEIYETNTEVDISTLEAGVYIIRLIDEISSSAQRFIVGI